MQLILFIIQKALNMNNQLKCDTVAQYKAYQWIKKNFDINYLTISIHDSYNTVNLKVTKNAGNKFTNIGKFISA